MEHRYRRRERVGKSHKMFGNEFHGGGRKPASRQGPEASRREARRWRRWADSAAAVGSAGGWAVAAVYGAAAGRATGGLSPQFNSVPPQHLPRKSDSRHCMLTQVFDPQRAPWVDGAGQAEVSAASSAWVGATGLCSAGGSATHGSAAAAAAWAPVACATPPPSRAQSCGRFASTRD